MFDQTKQAIAVFKMKSEIEKPTYSIDENGIEIDVGGFMALGEPKIKKLVVNGVENKMLLEMINKALKKATEASMKKMQELGKDLQQ